MKAAAVVIAFLWVSGFIYTVGHSSVNAVNQTTKQTVARVGLSVFLWPAYWGVVHNEEAREFKALLESLE